jgi:hypothetical protein
VAKVIQMAGVDSELCERNTKPVRKMTPSIQLIFYLENYFLDKCFSELAQKYSQRLIKAKPNSSRWKI